MNHRDFESNPLVESAGYFSVVTLCLIVSMVIFEIVTKYKNWEEIRKGNVAVALLQVEKYLVYVIFFAIPSNNIIIVRKWWVGAYLVCTYSSLPTCCLNF